MARDINERLKSLKARRSGTDRKERLTYDELAKAVASAAYADSYEKRSTGQKYTQYALGAMQEVGADYTRISIDTAQRVAKQLESGLTAAGIPVEFRLQGSVPANIHIRGYSDVDLLVLRTDFNTYATAGPAAQRGRYTAPSTRTSKDLILELRVSSTQILKARFPAAAVDTSGSKAVKISGGSLPRDVDVVPSHWFDTAGYQSSWSEVDRGVTIFDSKLGRPLDNYPFKHMELLNQRDIATATGLKKAIRLCKNVKSDAEGDIALSSFEIASLLYHADLLALRHAGTYDLAALAEAQRFFDYLYQNRSVAAGLKVPDGSRLILDTEEKCQAITSLSVELDSLAREVSKEQSVALQLYPNAGFDEIGRVLRETYIPAI